MTAYQNWYNAQRLLSTYNVLGTVLRTSTSVNLIVFKSPKPEVHILN